MSNRKRALYRLYPEAEIGNFSRVDVALDFYSRVAALVKSGDVVVDLGAGRGNIHVDQPDSFRSRLMSFKGRCGRVIGVDLDPAVLSNPSVDEARLIENGRLPLDDGSVDVVLSDWTFEHVDHPESFAAELTRVVKPGGWVCARTPNRWGYIGIATTLIPNKWHVAMLRILQPHRKEVDVFPTAYKLNTRRALRRYFPPSQWEHVVYALNGEPAYFGNSTVLWRFVQLLFRMTPPNLGSNLLVFMRKRSAGKPG